MAMSEEIHYRRRKSLTQTEIRVLDIIKRAGDKGLTFYEIQEQGKIHESRTLTRVLQNLKRYQHIEKIGQEIARIGIWRAVQTQAVVPEGV